MSGGAFALSSVVGEFISSCILIFIKHPYDVGDRVNISGTELEVVKISLLYTVFRRIDSDTLVQMENKSIGMLENVSRSGAMKEQLTLSVSAKTSFSDIEALRKELEVFVQLPENSRDFQPDIDIQLLSIGDMKQLDLRVQICHKVCGSLSIIGAGNPYLTFSVQLARREKASVPPVQVYVRPALCDAQNSD